MKQLPFDLGAFWHLCATAATSSPFDTQSCAATAGAMILPPPMPQTPMAYGTPAPVVYGQTAQPPAPAVKGFTQAAPSTGPAVPAAYGTPPSPAPAVYGTPSTPAVPSPAVRPFSMASPPAPVATAYGTPPTPAPPSYGSTSPVTPAVKGMATPPAASSPAPGEHICTCVYMLPFPCMTSSLQPSSPALSAVTVLCPLLVLKCANCPPMASGPFPSVLTVPVLRLQLPMGHLPRQHRPAMAAPHQLAPQSRASPPAALLLRRHLQSMGHRPARLHHPTRPPSQRLHHCSALLLWCLRHHRHLLCTAAPPLCR